MTQQFEHVSIETKGHIGSLWLDRSEKLNAMSPDMWRDIPTAVGLLDEDPEVRVIVLGGRGPAFTVGIDVTMLAEMGGESGRPDQVEERYRTIRSLQQTVSCLSEASKPVIAAVHGYCLGAGVNLISACDIRVATQGATFSIRETRMAVVADIGALQRLPLIIGDANTADLAFTGRDIDTGEAHAMGLVSRVYSDTDEMFNATTAIADQIAANSPLVLAGIKHVLNNGRNRPIAEGLELVARWNAENLISKDLYEAISAFMERRPPKFTGS